MTIEEGRVETISSAHAEFRWDPTARVAFIRYLPGARLGADDGAFLSEALTRWAGDGPPFAVIADAAQLEGTDGPYRARASQFFRQHRDRAFIAILNVGPVIHVVAEMFRVGTGIQLKTFTAEADARAWLRGKGIAA